MERKLTITNGPVEGLPIDTLLPKQVPVEGDVLASNVSAPVAEVPAPGTQVMPHPQSPLVHRSLRAGEVDTHVILPDGTAVDRTLSHGMRHIGPTLHDSAPTALGNSASGPGIRVDIPSIAGSSDRVPTQRTGGVEMVAATPVEIDKLRDEFADNLTKDRAVPQTAIWQGLKARLLQPTEAAPRIDFESDETPDGIKAVWNFSTDAQEVGDGRVLPATSTRVLARTAMEGLVSRVEERTGSVWDDTANVLNAHDNKKKQPKVKSASLFGVKGQATRNWRLARRYEYDPEELSDTMAAVIVNSAAVEVDVEVKIYPDDDSGMPDTLLHTVVARPEAPQPESALYAVTPEEVIHGTMLRMFGHRKMGVYGEDGSQLPMPSSLPVKDVHAYIIAKEHASRDPRQKDLSVSPQYGVLAAAMRFMPATS